MSKLTDKQKKKIIADRLNSMSIRALASKYGVSSTTIQKVVNSDTGLTQKITQKKEQNTIEVFAHMDSKKNDVCAIIDKLLEEISNEDKIKLTSLSQLATTMGILIDKFTANENKSVSTHADNNLIQQIQKAAQKIDTQEGNSDEV